MFKIYLLKQVEKAFSTPEILTAINFTFFNGKPFRPLDTFKAVIIREEKRMNILGIIELLLRQKINVIIFKKLLVDQDWLF